MGWQFHPSHLGKKSLSYHLSCPVHTQFRSSLALRFNRESAKKTTFCHGSGIFGTLSCNPASKTVCSVV